MENPSNKDLLILNHLFFKKGIEKTTENIIFLNDAFQVAYINPNFQNYLGVSESFIESHGGLSFLYKNLDIEKLKAELETKGVFELSEEIKSIDGRTENFHVIFESLKKKDGQITGIIVFHRSLKAPIHERNLSESENRYRLVFDEAFQYIALLDLEGKLLEANKSAIRFGCLSLSDFFNKYFWETHWWKTNPDSQQKIRDAISITLLGKSTSLLAHISQAGKPDAQIETHFKPVFDKQGKVSFIIGEGIDISWQQQLKDQLYLSQQRFKAIFDSASQFLALIEPSGKIADLNPTAKSLNNIEDEHLPQQLIWELPLWNKSPENKQLVSDTLSLCLTGKSLKRSIEITPENLPARIAEVFFKPIFDESGKVFLIAIEIPSVQVLAGQEGYTVPDTASFRKQVETKFGIIFELSVSKQKGWIFNYISPHIESRYGISPMLFDGNMQKISFNANALDHESFTYSIEQAIQNQSQWIFESKIKTTAGVNKWLLWIGKPFLVNPDEVVFNGLVLDITQRVLDEEKNRQAHEIYKLLIKNYPDGALALVNKQGKVLIQEGRNNLIKARDLQETEVFPKIMDVWEPADQATFEENISRIFSNQIQLFEFLHAPSQQEFQVKGIPIVDPDGSHSLAVLVFQNISEQKKALRQISDYSLSLEQKLSSNQLQLQEIEKKFSILFENSLSGILLLDGNDNIIQINPTLCRYLDYFEHEIKGKSITQFTAGTFPAMFQNLLVAGHDTMAFQHAFQGKDLKTVSFKILAGIVFNSNEEPLYSLLLFEPLEKEKNGNSGASESQWLKSMMAASLDPYILLSFKGNILEVNQPFTEITKYDAANARNLHYHQLDSLHSENEFQQLIEQLKSRQNISFDTKIKRQDQKYVKVRMSMSLLNPASETINCFISDLTHKEESAAAFKKSREFISSVVSNIQDLIFSLDPHRDILFISDQCIQITGYSPLDFLERKQLLNEIVFPIDKELLSRREDNIRAGIPYQIEYRILTKNGHIKWIKESAKASWDENGNLVRIDGSISDISNRKEAEEKLLKSEAALEEAQQMAKIGNGEFDLIEQNIHWSKEMYSIHGLGDIGKMLNIQNVRSLTHPADLDAFDMAIENAISQRTIQKVTYRIIRPDGEIRHIKSIVKPLGRPDSRVEKIFSTVVDITESEMSRIKLTENEQLLNLITENITDLVCLHDSKGAITYASPSSAQILGFSPDDLCGQNPDFFIHQEDFLFKLKGICKHFTPETNPPVIQIRVRNSNEEYIWMETLLKPIYKNGKKAGLLSSSRNISERKQAHEKIEQALEKEKELGNLKSRFVSMASHEFRTPLSTIQSSVEILSMQTEQIDPNLKESVIKHVNRIKNEIGRMTDLMNDVLNMGRLEAGRVEFRPSPVNLTQLLEELKETYFANLPSNRELEIDVTGEEKIIHADAKLLSHALKNLISNAFKYSEGKANPRVSINFKQEEVIIQIEDHGIGIPEKEKEKLFSSFFRASNTSNISGTGLGLVITRQFIELHKGSISFASTENEGTTFRISLPIH